MHGLHATRRSSDWKLTGINVLETLTEAFKNKELELQNKQKARATQLEAMMQ